jgi:hypothetical protein
MRWGSFWYPFHAYLITGRTAVVGCYPQDNGAISRETVTRASLEAFYTKHGGKKNLGNVDTILSTMSVNQIKEAMQSKYGNSPDVTVITKAKGAMTKLDVRNNDINNEEKYTLHQAAGSRYAQLTFLSFCSSL